MLFLCFSTVQFELLTLERIDCCVAVVHVSNLRFLDVLERTRGKFASYLTLLVIRVVIVHKFLIFLANDSVKISLNMLLKLTSL